VRDVREAPRSQQRAQQPAVAHVPLDDGHARGRQELGRAAALERGGVVGGVEECVEAEDGAPRLGRDRGGDVRAYEARRPRHEDAFGDGGTAVGLERGCSIGLVHRVRAKLASNNIQHGR
jgi:hypothetical protein